jgi:hypothetical protein
MVPSDIASTYITITMLIAKIIVSNDESLTENVLGWNFASKALINARLIEQILATKGCKKKTDNRKLPITIQN